MSTEQTLQIVSTDVNNTLEIGMKIGHKLRGGEVIELSGDLGSGKTTFTRGLAQGMGSTDQVHSPSFTISNQYKAKDLTIYHFDFHRLLEPGIMQQELSEILSDPQAVVIIEWANLLEDILPKNRLSVHIKPINELKREFDFSSPNELNYLTNT